MQLPRAVHPGSVAYSDRRTTRATVAGRGDRLGVMSSLNLYQRRTHSRDARPPDARGADGWPEIGPADTEGHVSSWNGAGQPCKACPVQVNRAYSESATCQSPPPIVPPCVHPVRDHVNTVDHAFTSNPSAGNLDP